MGIRDNFQIHAHNLCNTHTTITNIQGQIKLKKKNLINMTTLWYRH